MKRIIVLFIIFMMLGLGKTIIVEASDTAQEGTKLTEEFLTGTWIDAEGFVCCYKSGVFVAPSGVSYSECKISKGVVAGTSFDDETVSTKINIVDRDTIQVEGYTAVRAESKLGKEYQEQLANLLIGKWVNSDQDLELCYEFKKDKSLVLSIMNVEKDKIDYELTGGGMKLKNLENTKEERVFFFRIHEDTLSICNFMGQVMFYREGSNIAKEMQDGKADLLGDWIFVSNDGKLISQWTFDISDFITIEYFENKKATKQVFSASRKKPYIAVNVGEKTYNLKNTCGCGRLDSYEVSGDLEGILVGKDSEDGKYYINKAKTIYSSGKMIQQIQNKNFSDNLYPEVTAINVSLQCMSNLWLDDLININVYDRSLDQPGICGQSYEVVSNTKLKNAKITFTYNESQLPYDYEKDLVIVRMDEKTGKKTVLKTTRNSKSNKVAAKISKGGIYYLADSVVIKGGTRDITKRNPKSTEWARLNDTGDILSIIDLHYIKKSEGSFVVSNVSELASAVYYVNTTPDAVTWIFLSNDIDLSDYEWAPMGWVGPKGLNFEFNGMINGWDYTISNLHMDINGDNVGLLGYAPSAGVYNLKLTNAFIKGNSNVGILVGNAGGCGTYDNCYVSGEVYGEWAGSMLGNNEVSDFRDCTAEATVNGKKYNFLTYDEKLPCKIEVKDYLTITMDKDNIIHCPKVTGYDNLSWSVYQNGFRMEDVDAIKNKSTQFKVDEPGYHKVYLTTYKDGQYVRVSNVIEKFVE